jgi:hypothetical protein
VQFVTAAASNRPTKHDCPVPNIGLTGEVHVSRYCRLELATIRQRFAFARQNTDDGGGSNMTGRPPSDRPPPKIAPAERAVPELRRKPPMRQRRHTTAYAPSWQPSGNRAAPHGHSSGKKPRPFSRGAPIYATVGQVMAAVCGRNRRPTAGLSNAPRCPLRLQHWGASRLVSSGQSIAISGRACRWAAPARAANVPAAVMVMR